MSVCSKQAKISFFNYIMDFLELKQIFFIILYYLTKKQKMVKAHGLLVLVS